jgi:NAD(P)H-quinone oxidoreductase subunit 5
VLGLIAYGSNTSPLIGAGGVGISFRLDPLSVVMLALIAFVGLLVLEYSRKYMAGNDRQARFMGHLALTTAAAVLMATAGNLMQLLIGWVGMSLALHRLLLFYGDRSRARVAARKKFLVARIGDACLAVAVAILWHAFGTGDIAAILGSAAGAGTDVVQLAWSQAAVALIALAAILKSAQFPTHGWITEVMETPTPVSALLHAGIVNAGGFLVFRFADLVVLSPGSMQLLVVVGGFTALFGSLVMTSQSSIKVSLAYSTVAQMGFMLLQCGFGAFSSAGLHLVAHSLYKAHSFLASGNAVDDVKTARAVAQDEQPAGVLVIFSLLIALATYVGIGQLFDHDITASLAVQTLGASFIMGLFVFIARGASSREILVRVAPAAAVAASLYFSLQIAAATYFASQIPQAPAPDGLDRLLAALVLLSFAAVTLHQVLRTPATSRWYRAFYVHLNNGLYTNAVFNRLTGALRREPAN